MAIQSGLFQNQPDGIQPIATIQPLGTPKTFTPPVAAPTDSPITGWDYRLDPTYQASLAAGQSQFNFARNRDLAAIQQQDIQNKQQQEDLKKNSAEARRRLAGSYAARGMAGGSAGALALAEARANAEQIAAQTSLKDQMTALNATFLQNYGATGGDWLGTLAGQQSKTSAIQDALNARLKGMGI